MRQVIAIFGPTATGKTQLALRLAEKLNGEIVNADALQVYEGFDIGTAKPSHAERERVRHHLIDVLSPHAAYSAGRFVRLARQALAEIEERDRQALVVGGSGFYVRSLLEGLSPIPETVSEIREGLRQELDAEGLDAMRGRLREVDPETENRLLPGDSQRVLRALEVWTSTGKTLSEWTQRAPREPPLVACKVGLTLPRRVLYDRIAARVDAMLAAGWVEEVKGLLGAGLTGSEPAFQAIGYSQLVRYLKADLTIEEARNETVQATRRFAKRQMTWFRREERTTWFSARAMEKLVENVFRHVSTDAARKHQWENKK